MSSPGGSAIAAPARTPRPVAGFYRRRVLMAAVSTIDELGCSGATISRIVQRAAVSRAVFYELFAGRGDCMAAIIDDAVAEIEGELARQRLDALEWRSRLRQGLWTILAFFELRPELARVCLLHMQAGGAAVLERQDHVVSRLVEALEDGSPSGDGAHSSPLVAEGLVGAGLRVVYTRLATTDSVQLTDLVGELMSLLVLPYLGRTAAREEQQRPGLPPLVSPLDARFDGGQRFDDVLERLPVRLTYRTMMVLECVARHPGASNRSLATAAEIGDPGQASKLLSRLERAGLITNHGDDEDKWRMNAWTLTQRGGEIVRFTRMHPAAATTPEALSSGAAAHA